MLLAPANIVECGVNPDLRPVFKLDADLPLDPERVSIVFHLR